MMSKTDHHSSAEPNRPANAQHVADPNADWHQLEAFVDQLHELAHAPIDAQEFYRELLDGCVTLLAAEGGVVWLPAARGRWQALHQINSKQVLANEAGNNAAGHLRLLQNVCGTREPQIIQPKSRAASGGENPTDLVLALTTVQGESATDQELETQAIVELLMRPGSSPAVQQGWKELLETVTQVAAEFHVRQQLRVLLAERGCYDQSLALMHRFQQTNNLRQTAFEIANEGRRFVAADRLSVVVRRGSSWQVLAASGVERVEPRADVTKRLQMLAQATADWGEPLEYTDASGADTSSEESPELPPALSKLVEQQVDESQARRLVAVPVEFSDEHADENQVHSKRVAAVLFAEQFTSDAEGFTQQRVLELASLCGPALQQSMQLDRFPMRGCLRWADWWEQLTEKWGLSKLVMASAAVAMIVAALVFVRVDYEVAAPATLRPTVERDVFATSNGKVVDVRVSHGEEVAAGQVLAVLRDPQLSLDIERVEGEIATTRKRLESIAVARTDRQVREEVNHEKLPLAAEAEQLEKRLASLQLQQEILSRRREALTLRSPIAGAVLTLDVQNLLRTRPVERGQVLFTIADTTSGWRLLAEVPQDRIGLVVDAQREDKQPLPVRFRLAGDAEQTFTGQVESISTAAVLDTAGLEQESPAFEVNIKVDDSELLLTRPGMNAEVRIGCGRRALGYVWLHDIWENVYSWAVF